MAGDAEGPPPCLNCGSRFEGRYCPGCGQARVDRFTFRGIVQQTLSQAFDLDRGLVHTLFRLSLRPGRAVRRYLQGRTIPYTLPVPQVLYLVLLGHVAAA